MEMEDKGILTKAIDGILINPGDIFLSKVTGKIVMCCEADSDRWPCEKCVYSNSRKGYSGCIGLLRLVEAGRCTHYYRKDNKDVYFKEVESLYEIPQETKDLLKALYSSTLSFLENYGYIRLLLDTEYAIHKDNKG